MKGIIVCLCSILLAGTLCQASQASVYGEPANPGEERESPARFARDYPPVSLAAESTYLFELAGLGRLGLVFEDRARPQIRIQSYMSGGARLALIMGCLVATGAGLAFVAPLATVPAAIGPLANAGAGAAATGAAGGEAWAIDALVGRSRADTFRDAIASVDVPALVFEALLRYLGASEQSPEGAMGELKVILEHYGFSSYDQGKVCNSIRLRAILRMAGREDMEDTVSIEYGATNEDVPPAHCTSLGRLLENEGSLLRQILRESSEIAAALVAHRVKEVHP